MINGGLGVSNVVAAARLLHEVCWFLPYGTRYAEGANQTATFEAGLQCIVRLLRKDN